MIFTISIPTCREGLTLPVPFASAQELVEMAVLADRLGYHSVWGNDHITPPSYVRDTYAQTPNFFEPLTILGYVAARTEHIGLGTSVIPLPLREPAYLAKQVATLDVLSGGRVLLGVGLGAYREEYERLWPRRRTMRREELLNEGVEALRLLFAEEEASYAGKHVAFDGIRLAPKPVQQPLPLYVAGNSAGAIERAARWGAGWLPAALAPADVARGAAQLHAAATRHGRDPASLHVGPQLSCVIAPSREAARRRFEGSQTHKHLVSLAASTLKGADLSRLEDTLLIGSPAELVDQIAAYAAAGATMLAAMIFVSETPRAMLEDIQHFAEEVIPAFAARA
ncbi:MAG TPA: TIGR03619 family F420-dependent LLM class oxidoreductase [Chloroflexota bacterium]|jgi:probable F420-dependent oxidoreductase